MTNPSTVYNAGEQLLQFDLRRPGYHEGIDRPNILPGLKPTSGDLALDGELELGSFSVQL